MQSSSSSVLSLSPSFNSYSSSSKLAEIAARVVEEYRNESDVSELNDDVFGLQNFNKSIQQLSNNDDDHDDDDDDDEFEFPSLCEAPTSPISADEIFYNGQIKPIYPIFDTNLLLAEFGNGISEVPSKPPARVPLRKLMSEDRDPPSCSSSEADDLDGVPDGTYCVWTPKASAAADSPEKCRKSNSTGSSKRWKFRDLLHRSNSDGKETFLFLNTKKKEISAPEKSSTGAKVKVAVGGVEVVPVTAAQEAYYGRQRVAVPKEADRRRSFLPYRQDLVGGFFANVNGMSRNLHPF